MAKVVIGDAWAAWASRLGHGLSLHEGGVHVVFTVSGSRNRFAQFATFDDVGVRAEVVGNDFLQTDEKFSAFEIKQMKAAGLWPPDESREGSPHFHHDTTRSQATAVTRLVAWVMESLWKVADPEHLLASSAPEDLLLVDDTAENRPRSTVQPELVRAVDSTRLLWESGNPELASQRYASRFGNVSIHPRPQSGWLSLGVRLIDSVTDPGHVRAELGRTNVRPYELQLRTARVVLYRQEPLAAFGAGMIVGLIAELEDWLDSNLESLVERFDGLGSVPFTRGQIEPMLSVAGYEHRTGLAYLVAQEAWRCATGGASPMLKAVLEDPQELSDLAFTITTETTLWGGIVERHRTSGDFSGAAWAARNLALWEDVEATLHGLF